MRLDVFLKTSRLVKRRTVAKEACDNGRIRLDGKPAKPASEVKPGQAVALDYGSHVITVRVLAVPAANVARAEAASLYEVVSDVWSDRKDRPFGDRPGGDRPGGDRPAGGRSAGGRSAGGREPSGDGE